MELLIAKEISIKKERRRVKDENVNFDARKDFIWSEIKDFRKCLILNLSSAGWYFIKKHKKGEAKPAKDGVLKCVENVGWQSKPQSLECLKKKQKHKEKQ